MALGVNAALLCPFSSLTWTANSCSTWSSPRSKMHYDNMPRRDMTKMPYEMNKPNYEYNV